MNSTPSRLRPLVRTNRVALSALLVSACGMTACGSSASKGAGDPPVSGQSDFVSAPLSQQGIGLGASQGSSAGTGGGVASGTAAPATDSVAAGPAQTTAPDRQVEETDLYRVEGDRLYYLNA